MLPPYTAGAFYLSDLRTMSGPSEQSPQLSLEISPLAPISYSDDSDDDEVESSMAVQVLNTFRDQSGPEVPAFLANTLSKALAANNLALSLTPAHQDFQKAWDFSQTSLSACKTLIGRWKKTKDDSDVTPITAEHPNGSGADSPLDEIALMQESVELGL